MTEYKHSELSDIPKDWEVVALGEIGTVEMCRRIFKHETQPIGDIPFYKIGTFGDEADAYISKAIFEEYKVKYPYPNKDDILISAAGTIGRTIIFSGKPSYYQDSNIVWLNINDNKISNLFLYYVYQNTKWTSLEGSTIKRLYNSDLLSKQIRLPEKSEQTAIATVLSDTDQLIASLEKVIAKKQAIKSATMHQLLSGQKRLPTFAQHSDGTPKGYLKTEHGEIPEDWEVVALGDLAFIKTGSKNNQDKQENGQYPFFVRSQTVERINCYSYDCEAILIPGEGGIGSIFYYINGKFDAHQRVYVIRDFQNVNGKFVFYALKQYFGKYAMENSVKATVDSLRLPTFQNFQFIIPKSIAEQTAIAQILSDMDSDIIALQNRLAKVRQIKQGLMHNLLTGKMRLSF